MRIHVQVKPNSRTTPHIEETAKGTYIVYVREAARDGEANAAAIRVLAKHLKVAPSLITLARGGGSRYKTFVIG